MSKEAGRPWNGTLRKTLEVHCAGCEQAVLGLSGNHDMAKEELRQRHGWGTRKGLWNCRDCKDDPEKVNARSGI